MEKHDFVRPVQRVVYVVGGHHYGDSAFGHPVNDFVDHSGVFRVKGSGGLVQYYYIRVHNEDIGDGNLFFLSSA